MVKKLQWDSDFFNLIVGEINYNENYIYENLSEYDLIYMVSKEKFELKLECFESKFSETKITFFKILEKMNPISESIYKFEEISIEKEDLYSLAYESGKNSRFLLDKNFNKNHFNKLYQAWIDNLINKKFADDVLIYYEENKV